jgi:DNA-binding GntR family transcriptional regulator
LISFGAAAGDLRKGCALKSDAVYKQAFNDALTIIGGVKRGERIPSESVLSAHLAVSRTTVRKALSELTERGLISKGPNRIVVARPKAADRFPGSETIAASEHVERKFMEWMLRGDLRPGATINMLELARSFGVSTTVLRDFLNGFERYGLIEKRPNASWTFAGMTPQFASELFDVRELFEMRSARAFIGLRADHPAWTELAMLRTEHEALAREVDQKFQDFSQLDARFHRLIFEASSNRFMRDFYDIMALIFHYHYQWNKAEERQRNATAIKEHLVYIDALRSRDWRDVEAAAKAHLRTARRTLHASLRP